MNCKNTLYIFIFIFTQSVYSQNKKVSITFNDLTVENAILKIESISDYRFYFDKTWADLQNKITLTFNDSTIEEILQITLESTNLNFVILKQNIIITQNNYVYTKLNSNLIANSNHSQLENPIFYNNTDSPNNNKNIPNEEIKQTIIIGKQDKQINKSFYYLEGYLSDKKNNQGISNAIIKTKTGKYFTNTNEVGYYKLKLPEGKNELEILPIAHENIYQTIILKTDGQLNFTTFEKITQLNEIILEGEKNKSIKEVISGLTSFNMEKTKNIPLVLGERDIIKIATTLPGIKTTGEGSAGFNVRGGKEDQNLILLDNATIYNPSHFFGFFTAVNPYTVNNVNIYKGSIPSKFGGRISSVFEIETKDGNLNTIKGEGGIGPVTSNLTISSPIFKEKSSLLFGGRATYSDLILKQINNEEIKNSKASFYDIYVKYKHKINKNNNLTSSFYYSNDKFKLTSDSLYTYSNQIISLNWKHFFNQNHSGEINISNSEYKFNIDYKSDNLQSFDFGFKVNETKLIVLGKLKLNEKHEFNYGINSTFYNINPGKLTPTDNNSQLEIRKTPKDKGLESALFISDNFSLNEKISFNVGFRCSNFLKLGKTIERKYDENFPISNETIIAIEEYNNNEIAKAYNGIEYRIATRYLINESTSIKLSFDSNYQYLHKLSTNTTQSPTDTWKLSDTNIKPTLGQQISLGLFKTFKDELYEVSIESYYKKTSNFLDYKVGAELILNDHIETEVLQGIGKAYGVEFLLKKNKGRLNGWVGYTYSRTLIKLDGDFNEQKINNGNYFPASFDKPHDFNSVLNYKITKRYSISSNFVYQTGRPITYPIGNYNYGGATYTLYSDRNQFRIPDYYRLDIGVNIEGNHKLKKIAHSFWNISIYNVLGRNNPYSIYFTTKNGEVKGYKTSIFSIPIPTITYNFKF